MEYTLFSNPLFDIFNEYKLFCVVGCIFLVYFGNCSIAKTIGHRDLNPSNHMVTLSSKLSIVLFLSRKYNRFNIWMLLSQIYLFIILVFFFIDIIFLQLTGGYYFYIIIGGWFLFLTAMSIDLTFFDR